MGTAPSRSLDHPMRRRKDRQKLKKKMFKAAEKAQALQPTDPAGKAAALPSTNEKVQSALYAAADRSSNMAAPELLPWCMVPEKQSRINAYPCQVPAQSKTELKTLPFTMTVKLKNTFLEVDFCNEDGDDQFSYFSLSRSTGRSSIRSISVPR